MLSLEKEPNISFPKNKMMIKINVNGISLFLEGIKAAKMMSINLTLTPRWIASITKHGPFCNLGQIVGYADGPADPRRR